MDFFDDYDIEDAAFLGAVFGMADQAIREESAYPPDGDFDDRDRYDFQDPGYSLDQMRRNDPVLYQMVLDVLEVQRRRRGKSGWTPEDPEMEGVNQGLPPFFFDPRHYGGLSDKDFYDFPDIYYFENCMPEWDIPISFVDDRGQYYKDVPFSIRRCLKTNDVVYLEAVEKTSGKVKQLRMDHIQYINGKKRATPAAYPIEEPITPDYRLRKTPLYISYSEGWKKAFSLNDDESLVKPVKNRFDFSQWGVVKDATTGLMWWVQDIRAVDISKVEWELTRIHNIAYEGYQCWRLPTVNELLSLRESEKQEHGWWIDQKFQLPSPATWSADYSPQEDGNWVVLFDKVESPSIIPLPKCDGPIAVTLLAVRSCNVTSPAPETR